MTIDIKNYYLGTLLPTYEYMWIHIAIILDRIIEKYDPKGKTVDGWVYLEIWKGMYGLKQAGILENQWLKQQLDPFGYYPYSHTAVLWLHKTQQI